MKAKETALEELQRRLQSEREEEVQQLKEKFEAEITQLRDDLSDRTSELELAQAELQRLESELSKREKGLGSAADSLERLREELRRVRGDLSTARRGNEERTKERDKLVVSRHGSMYVLFDWVTLFRLVRCGGSEGAGEDTRQNPPRTSGAAEEGADRGGGEQVEGEANVRGEGVKILL